MKIKKAFPAIIFLAVSFIGSYAVFTVYRPKTLVEISRIKGYSTERQQVIPYPMGSKEIGKDVSSDGKRITLETTKTPEDVKAFYLNVYTVRGWKLVSTGQSNNTEVISFSKDGVTLSISTSTAKDLAGTVIVIDEKN
jgi:hypothetical protein